MAKMTTNIQELFFYFFLETIQVKHFPLIFFLILSRDNYMRQNALYLAIGHSDQLKNF